MARYIENPFKERRIRWVQYAIIGVVSLAVLWFLFAGGGGDGRNSISTSSSSSFQQAVSDTQHANLRDGIVSTNGRSPNKEEEDKGLDGNDDDDTAAEAAIEAMRMHDGANVEVEEKQEEEEQEEGRGMDNKQNEEEEGGGDGMDDDVTNPKEENEEGGGIEVQYTEEFPELSQDEYPTWLKQYYKKLEWGYHPPQTKLTRRILQESLRLGCDNIAANQKEEGNFNYLYDFVKQRLDKDDSPVRQAGALWGMALCFQYYPENRSYQKAVERGFQFFETYTEPGPAPGSVMIHYPDATESETGVNALFGLAIVEYIRTLQDHANVVLFDGAMMEQMNKLLSSVVQYLKYLQNDDLHFSAGYHFKKNRKTMQSSPYYDGEVMLCLCKAARYLDGYDILVPTIVETAPILAKEYTLDKWHDNHDSDQTKGFYQWSSMFLTEYYQARWQDYELFGDYVIVLANWIIYTHRILNRNRNTGYAYEGIISAYQIIKDRGDNAKALNELSYTIDEGLYRLSTWQVGGPLSDRNPYLAHNPTVERIAVGGVMNAVNQAPLRIDTTQHQMHAIMMALQTIYTE